MTLYQDIENIILKNGYTLRFEEDGEYSFCKDSTLITIFHSKSGIIDYVLFYNVDMTLQGYNHKVLKAYWTKDDKNLYWYKEATQITNLEDVIYFI